jgi:hypothetical protein
MSVKDLPIATLQAHFKEWAARMDAIKARLEEGERADRLEFHKQVDASQRQHETSLRHIDELKQSSELALQALKKGVETALNELIAAVKKEQS